MQLVFMTSRGTRRIASRGTRRIAKDRQVHSSTPALQQQTTGLNRAQRRAKKAQ